MKRTDKQNKEYDVKLLATIECEEFEKKNPFEFYYYGCGPGGIGDWFVPDTMWGLSMRPACRIHDWDYRHGEGCSEEHRKECDQRLRDNCKIIVNYHTKSKIVKSLRYVRINTYYFMVRTCGKSSYWNER